MIEEARHFQEYLLSTKKDMKTAHAYSTDIHLFLEYIKKPILLINEIDIEKYKMFLHSNGYKISTINRKMVSLNLFMKHNKHNVQINKEKSQMISFLDNVIEVEELEDIIKQARLKNDYMAIALLSTLFLTGMRIFECLQLKVTDVYKDTIVIRGKGKKYRNVFIPSKLKTIWQEYLPHRIKKGDMLFTGREGAITTRTSNNIFKKYAILAGVDPSKAHNHNLRHLYAKRLANKKVNIEVIADLLGHSSLETSRLYLKSTKKELLNIIDSL